MQKQATLLHHNQPSTHSPCSPATEATVLLVEDEDAVRRVAGEVLANAGYSVLEAKNGREALQLVDRLHAAPAVLITDVVMPLMNGPELAGELSARYPQMRTVFISGYAEHPLLARKRGLTSPAWHLHKPFSVEALTGIVARALENKKGQ